MAFFTADFLQVNQSKHSLQLIPSGQPIKAFFTALLLLAIQSKHSLQLISFQSANQSILYS
jgi:hypothetical protein